MTEQKWRTCHLQHPMNQYLKGRVSQRKLRLFAVACCRRVWSHLKDVRSRSAVELAERFADNHVKKQQSQQAKPDAVAAFIEIARARTGERDLFHPLFRAIAVFRRSAPAAVRWACMAALVTADDAMDSAKTAESVANVKDLAAHCDLLREVV